MSGPRDLNALLGSRICHDLISPLGAIGNGVELLSMSPAGSSPEIALIAESVENANARIRYFRVAFGAASAEANLGRAEIVDILTDLTRGGRIGIEWNASGALARGEVKLAFLVILCLETAMPWGGQIHVSTDDERWFLGATAERLKVDPELWELMANPCADVEVTSARVQFALVPETARAIGRTLRTDIRDNYINVSF